MPKFYNLTVEVIAGLPVPPKGSRVDYRDERVRGLSLRVSGAAGRIWYVTRWAVGSSQRVRLGEYPGIKVDEARRLASQINATIARREDPGAEARARREEKTFGELFAWYMEAHSRPRKLSSARDQSRFDHYLAGLAKLPASKVTKSVVRELHVTIAKIASTRGVNHKSGIYAANRTLALISVVFGKAIAYELHAGSNPATGVEAFREESRDRRLGSGELEAFLAAVEAEPSVVLRDFVYLAMCTGVRRSNLLAMRWEEIDTGSKTWRIPRTKNGSPQLVPLEDAELLILERRCVDATEPWVFPGREPGTHLAQPGHGWARILKRAGIKDLRLHDLRRTLGSAAADQGVSLQTIGAMLGHKSMTATLVYARLDQQTVRAGKRAAQAAIFGDRSAAPESPKPTHAATRRRQVRSAVRAAALTPRSATARTPSPVPH